MNIPEPRKIFLDCGCYTGDTINRFLTGFKGMPVREDAREFIIYGFDGTMHSRRWGKLLSTYPEVSITHIQKLVWVEDTVLTYSFIDGKGASSNKIDSLPVKFHRTRKNTKTREHEAIDFSRWLFENCNRHDYIVLKMDIEGAEYQVLDRMFSKGQLEWIDELYIEFHRMKGLTWAPYRDEVERVIPLVKIWG